MSQRLKYFEVLEKFVMPKKFSRQIFCHSSWLLKFLGECPKNVAKSFVAKN
jgi:hypothetical protein